MSLKNKRKLEHVVKQQEGKYLGDTKGFIRKSIGKYRNQNL